MARERIRTASFAYPDQCLTAPLASASNKQLEIYRAAAYNATAAENSLGLFHSITDQQVKLWQLLAGGDTEITDAVQGGTASAIFSTTNNDGVLFQSEHQFNVVTFNVSQASTGSPVYTYKYYNGSGYVTLTPLQTPSFATTGIKALVFNVPSDWAVGDGSEGADASLYSIQVIATTAPSQAVQINSLKLGRLLAYSDAIAASGSLEVDLSSEPLLLQVGESILPFFSYTNASNRLDADYKISP